MPSIRRASSRIASRRSTSTPSRMRFVDPAVRRAYRFAAGQFNMLYAYGVGEVPISIVSDPDEPDGARAHDQRRRPGDERDGALEGRRRGRGARPVRARLADGGRARARRGHRHGRPRLRPGGRRHRLHLPPPRRLRDAPHPARGEDAARSPLPGALRRLAPAPAHEGLPDRRPARRELALSRRRGDRTSSTRSRPSRPRSS